MTAIGPYVVVFWTLSRLVLVRKGYDAAFLLYSQSNIVEQAVTCSWVPIAQITWSPRQQATTFTPRFNSSSTRVTGLHPKKVKQASKLYPAGTVSLSNYFHLPLLYEYSTLLVSFLPFPLRPAPSIFQCIAPT